MSDWNVAQAAYRLGVGPLAGRPALIHGEHVISYAELRRRASGIASYLRGRGLAPGAHVGHYLRNSNAYLETFVGAGLAGLSHVNVNYRYRERELLDLCQGLDIAVLVYDREFAPQVAAIRAELPDQLVLVEVAAGEPGEASALPGADALTSLYDLAEEDFQSCARGEDLILIATGGTTGLPKGVQWRHEDLWRKMNMSTGGPLMALGLEDHPDTLDGHLDNLARVKPAWPFLALSPLMHGAGLMMALMMLAQGAAVVTLPGRRLDPELALDVISRHQVGSVVLVGDAFVLPLLQALEQRPDRPLSSLRSLVSSGASLSANVRSALLAQNPQLVIIDSLGSSEASGYALSTDEPGVFQPLPTTRILDGDGRDVVPGSEVIGMAYAGGHQPVGYYNEPEKSAETFVTIDGQRYVKTGDRCRVRQDGKLVLLGRDSTVINTGGEKVYTVEVEQVLTRYPGISDALVVGLPHPRFGRMVVAVVEGPGLTQEGLDEAALRVFLAAELADYKVPRVCLVIESLGRGPNGKADYTYVTDWAAARLAELQPADTGAGPAKGS